MIWLPRLAKSWFWSICKTCVLFKPSQIRQIAISQILDFVNSIISWFAKRAFFSTKYFHSSFKITATRSWSPPPPISITRPWRVVRSHRPHEEIEKKKKKVVEYILIARRFPYAVLEVVGDSGIFFYCGRENQISRAWISNPQIIYFIMIFQVAYLRTSEYFYFFLQ